MRLLDLFCGGGGAAMGYARAGFCLTGVDHQPQPLYPFDFVQEDALQYLSAHGTAYDVIHASPPCQAYSALRHFARKEHPDLVDAIREALIATRRPWVIENVVGAPLRRPLLLCGSMFGLQTPCGAQLRRHRLFESSLLLMSPGACQHGERMLVVNGNNPRDEATRWAERRKSKVISITGSTPQQNVERNRIRQTFSVESARIAMGIDWLPMRLLSQAIPPAYTQWIGKQLLSYLSVR